MSSADEPATKKKRKRNPSLHVYDRNMLPHNWWNDEFFRDEVHRKIRELIREGYSNVEVADRLGVDNNSVGKQRARMGAFYDR